MVARLDAHQQFWTYNPVDYTWMGDNEFLKQNYLPKHVQPYLIENGLHGSIVVQARQTIEETDFLLALQREHAFIKAVVGWIDLRAENISETLAGYQGTVAGFRHQLEDEHDLQHMNSPEFHRGIKTLGNMGFTYDLLITPEHLPVAVELVDAFPNQRFVIDHLAKPTYEGDIEGWQRGIVDLARRDNVYCKLSGMVTEVAHQDWRDEVVPVDPFIPYMDVVLEAFSASRLMFGSDWPVCNLAATYDEVVDIVNAYIHALSPSEQRAIMGETAAAFYGVDIE